MLKGKQLLIAGAIGLVVVGGGVFAASKLMSKPATTAKASPAPKKKITDPVNIIAQSERPYILITPKDARTISLSVQEVKKSATFMDFELEYQTETNLEGAGGTLQLDQLPVIKDILLGSCSAGGACRYHKDVKGGTLLVKFGGGEQTYALKQDWKYIENTKKEKMFGSRDGKFQVTADGLAAQSILILYNSPGYPKNPKGTVISEVYTLAALNALKGSSTVTIRMTEEAAGAKVLGWNGKDWQTLTTTVDGKVATATGELLTAYVVVK